MLLCATSVLNCLVSRVKKNNHMVKSYTIHLLFFFTLLFICEHLTAPKSRVLLKPDSSLRRVTQHPTSHHPSISTQPSQHLLPITSRSTIHLRSPVCLRAQAIYILLSSCLPPLLSHQQAQIHTPQTFHAAFPPP